MSDIRRNNHLVEMNAEMKKKHIEIMINEKKSVIHGLKRKLEDLENVEAKKLRLEIEMREKEISELQKNINAIEV